MAGIADDATAGANKVLTSAVMQSAGAKDQIKICSASGKCHSILKDKLS
jgi:hypothetical protein